MIRALRRGLGAWLGDCGSGGLVAAVVAQQHDHAGKGLDEELTRPWQRPW